MQEGVMRLSFKPDKLMRPRTNFFKTTCKTVQLNVDSGICNNRSDRQISVYFVGG